MSEKTRKVLVHWSEETTHEAIIEVPDSTTLDDIIEAYDLSGAKPRPMDAAELELVLR